MDFDEFVKCCNFDFYTEDGRAKITAIYSAGFRKEFSEEFVEDNRELAEKLVADDLYHYVSKEFRNNG